ncbi:MAG: O-antigen ligase family protein [Burkholderiales bacterium]|nr:O-antigen ligase family protein [Burkholderiales bacterium]
MTNATYAAVGNNAALSAQNWRQTLPQQILSYLPLTLFFPVGVMYGGVLLFYISCLLSADFAGKWKAVRSSPLLLPVSVLSAVSLVVALTQAHPEEIRKEFWPGFWHYQTYLFLFPFLTVRSGEWQGRAVKVFFFGAVMASTLFVANYFHLLPANTLFRSYVIYEGNKSILLGILLAVAAGWMLHEMRLRRDYRILRSLLLLYIVAALFLLAKTRTASLLFLLLCALMLVRNFSWSWRSLVVPFVLLAALAGGWKYALSLPEPATCEVRLVQAGPWAIFQLRTLCTIHQLRDFSAGRKISDDGMRLEIYKLTGEIIAEKPWTGHGIASWMMLYRQRAQGLVSATMTTPHNDYLLYLTELGVPGLLALLFIWGTQFWTARRMVNAAKQEQRERAMLLAMLTVAMMVGGMFNAILRDGVFGMAFMILLAVPLAGVRRPESVMPPE